MSVIKNLKVAKTNQDLNKNLGQKNNNPLNIRVSSIKWKGEVKPDNQFEKFDTIENGFRAAIALLRTYIETHKCNSLPKIINRWAPPIENKTNNYISFVSTDSGITQTEVIKFEKGIIFKLISAMSVMESNTRPTLAQLETAWKLL